MSIGLDFTCKICGGYTASPTEVCSTCREQRAKPAPQQAKAEAPPRRMWLIIDRDGAFEGLYTSTMEPKESPGRTHTEVFSEESLRAAEARARADWLQSEYEKWRKENPDFKPTNQYCDAFKDAFYLGYGRGREDAAKAAEARAALTPAGREKE